MTQQPEALRLADRLDLYATGDAHQQDIEQAAAELRRLHQSEREGWRYAKEWEARATRLAKALGQAMEALEQYTDVVTSVNDPNSWVKVEDGGKPARKAITTAKQALEDKS
jgi:predicted transcriptional regulator